MRHFVHPIFTALILVIALGVALPQGAGATPALCKVHADACQEKDIVTDLHMESVGSGFILLNDTANVLCLKSLIKGHPSSSQSSLIELEAFTLENCGTTAAHNTCTVTVEATPTSLELTRTALNLGTAALQGGKVRFQCTILGFVKIDCTYTAEGVSLGFEGALHKAETGHGMLSGSKVSMPSVGGELCPGHPTLDALYEPLEHVFLAAEVS